MDGRGWDWPASEIRRAQLVEWVVRRSAEWGDGVYAPLDSFYDALPDQSINTYEIALDDVEDLERRSLIDLLNSRGSVWDLRAQSTPEGRAFTDDLQATRSDTQRRRSACRDAMVDWLYSRDAVKPLGVVRDKILQDRRGHFFAEPFTANDLDSAAAWLYRQSLVSGAMIAQAQGPVRLYLTDTGVKCVEDFGSDTGAYLQRQQSRPPGPTVNIGTNTAPFQVAGDYAHQVQSVGTSADNDNRSAFSAAWGVVAVVAGGGAAATWTLNLSPGSKFPAWPAWILSSLTAVGIYICFAFLSAKWPTRHERKRPEPTASAAANKDDAGQQISSSPGSIQVGPRARMKLRDVIIVNPPAVPQDEVPESPKV